MSQQGADTFQYTATNAAGTSAAATVSITVNPSAPVANNVSASVAENSTSDPVTLNVAGGAAASVAVSTQAGQGTATASGTSISYTPTTGFSGADTFQYTATNASGTSSAATVSITVNPLPALANAVSATVALNSNNDPIMLNITGGTATGVSISTQASNGTAIASGTSITYTPASGFTGADSFQYTATNSSGVSSPATVSITVTQLSPPAISAFFGQAIMAVNGSVELAFTLANPNIGSGGAQAVHPRAASSGAKARRQLSGSPVAGASPADDSSGGVPLTGVGFTDALPAGLVVAAPNSLSNSCGGTPAAAVGASSITLSGGSLDVAGDPCVLSVNVTATAAGSYTDATGLVTSTETGPGAASNSVSIVAINPPGISVGFGAASIPVNGSTPLTLSFSNQSAVALVSVTDVDSLPPGLAITNPPGATGTCLSDGANLSAISGSQSVNVSALSLAAGQSCSLSVNVTGTSAGTQTNTTGAVTAIFDDGSGLLRTTTGGTASASITVASVAPIANAVSEVVLPNSANDAVPLNITGGVATVVAIATQATHGTATASGTSISYTPTAGYTGADSFSYTATNAGGTSGAAAASITVRAPVLTIAKSHAGSLTRGQTGTYTITVGNSSSSAGSTTGTVTMTDALPSSLTATAISGSGWTCTLSPLTCTRNDSLAAGSSYPSITLTVNVPVTIPLNTTLTNSASASGGGSTSNVSASASAPLQ